MVVACPHHGGEVVILTPQHLVTLQAGLVLGVTVVTVTPVHHSASHLELDLVLLDAVNLQSKYGLAVKPLCLHDTDPIEMAVQTVLTRVLLAALRADDVRVLVLEVNVLYVSLQGHLVEV